MNGFISYEGLPIKAGGAHAISRYGPAENLRRTRNFLSKYTNARSAVREGLVIYHENRFDLRALKLVSSLLFRLGLPKYRYDGLYTHWGWNLSHKNTEWSLLFLKQLIEKAPASVHIKLDYYWVFQFKHPDSQEVLPEQYRIPSIDTRNDNSSIYLRLGRKSSLSTWMVFPFEDLNDEAQHYLSNLKKELPFKASPHHWRLWKKSKNGNWIPKKIKV